ncbi:MAG: MarR family winged helix-turn-helix transcriptional regulator [Rhodocyclales bacterium]|nr:MarR family winged helix-turn-helix transcriptional regulator [Rhodocyclales bacterium]
MNSATVAPKGCTNFKTRQLSRLLSRHYDAELAKVGLKTTQYSLLTHVLRLGPLAPGELARHMGLDASTLTRNLQPLLASGWLLQEAGADARSRFITITPAGRNKQAEALRHWKTAQQRINAALGLERVASLHALLDDCTAQLQAGAADQP